MWVSTLWLCTNGKWNMMTEESPGTTSLNLESRPRGGVVGKIKMGLWVAGGKLISRSRSRDSFCLTVKGCWKSPREETERVLVQTSQFSFSSWAYLLLSLHPEAINCLNQAIEIYTDMVSSGLGALICDQPSPVLTIPCACVVDYRVASLLQLNITSPLQRFTSLSWSILRR